MYSQKGSIHVIISAFLIVLLIGTLGFIFWRSYTNQENKVADNKTSSSTTHKEPLLLTAEVDKTFPKSLSVQYPEGWKLESNGRGPLEKGETTDQSLLLSSPSKNYEVAVKVGVNGGVGGTCDSALDPSTIKYLHKVKLNSFDRGLFVEQITDTYSITNGTAELDGYQYIAGIYANNDRINSAKVGDSRCNTYLGNVLELSSEENMTLLYAQINLKKLESRDKYGDLQPIKSLDSIKNEFNNSEYDQATKILKSISVN